METAKDLEIVNEHSPRKLVLVLEQPTDIIIEEFRLLLQERLCILRVCIESLLVLQLLREIEDTSRINIQLL